jgi:hypothetical protein
MADHEKHALAVPRGTDEVCHGDPIEGTWNR